MATLNKIFRGKVEGGRIRLLNKGAFRSYLALFEGKPIELIIREKRYVRSDEQNKYYWGVIISILGDNFGYEKDEMHEILKKKFGIKSTSDLKSPEFKEYINKIIVWAASDLGIALPDPDSVDDGG